MEDKNFVIADWQKKKKNPFFTNNRVNIEAYIEFLCQYNDFINHTPKPQKKIKDDVMIF